MTGSKRLLGLAAALAAWSPVAPPAPLLAQAGNVTVEQVKVIEAPRVFHPGADDKAGYWEDFGLTEAFDFHPATQTLVAAIKPVNGFPRLFVFDLATGAIRFRTEIAKDTRMSIKEVKLSPDGTLAAVATGRGQEITLWRMDSGTKVANAKVDGEANNVDWHPSGQQLAVVAGKGIEIWKVTGTVLTQERKLNGSRDPREWPFSARWSPDGATLAIATNGPAVYLAAADGTRQSPSLGPMSQSTVYMAEWNATGQRLATGGFGTNGPIAIWGAVKPAPAEPSFALLQTFTPPAGQEFRKLTWDPSGELIAFGDSQANVHIREAATGRQLATVVAHAKSKVIEAHWKGDRLITVGAFPDKSFRIWRVTKPAEVFD